MWLCLYVMLFHTRILFCDEAADESLLFGYIPPVLNQRWIYWLSMCTLVGEMYDLKIYCDILESRFRLWDQNVTVSKILGGPRLDAVAVRYQLDEFLKTSVKNWNLMTRHPLFFSMSFSPHTKQKKTGFKAIHGFGLMTTDFFRRTDVTETMAEDSCFLSKSHKSFWAGHLLCLEDSYRKLYDN